MDFRDWWHVLSGLAGLALAGYGARLLVTGRLPGFARRRWERPRDAGMWFLCGGVCFVSLAVGYLGRLVGVLGATALWALLALGTASLALGLVRYRPRHDGARGGSRRDRDRS
ncbi:hypothetical protein ACLQ20_00075 [Micromonospora sp. DT46]|uniref:hypothetical protein n=1 Tax=Micromonospora sp. DT46 TaxID=3393435 RepID=UPI003CE86AA5